MVPTCKLRQVCQADWDLLAINIEETRAPLPAPAPEPDPISLDDSGSSSDSESGNEMGAK